MPFATTPPHLCSGGSGINTALGCLQFGSPQSLSQNVFVLGLGIGGGVAFLLIVLAGYIMVTSQGNPRRLEGGKALLGSAVGGLILLIFSGFILELLGVDILGLL